MSLSHIYINCFTLLQGLEDYTHPIHSLRQRRGPERNNEVGITEYNFPAISYDDLPTL